jgi:hypothetical protein
MQILVFYPVEVAQNESAGRTVEAVVDKVPDCRAGCVMPLCLHRLPSIRIFPEIREAECK